MAEAHEIVRTVLDAFPALPGKLKNITSKVAEWWNSHGREPKSQNPLSTGNPSAVTHFMQFCRLYEAGEKGAGEMLIRRVFAELEMEFAASDCEKVTNEKLRADVLKESYDVLKCLNEDELTDKTLPELAAMEEEGAQLRDVASDYVSHIRVIRRQRQTVARKF